MESTPAPQERLTSAIKSVRFNADVRTLRELVSVLKGMDLESPEVDEAILEAMPKPGESKLEREFPYMKPRCWQNPKTKQYLKVLPWFQPLDNESRLDFKGMMQELAPELFTNDVMAEVEFYSGLVSLCGYQIYNDGGMWFCVEPHAKQHFTDLGEWDDAKYGKPVPAIPLTKAGEERKKAADAKRKRKKRGRNKR